MGVRSQRLEDGRVQEGAAFVTREVSVVVAVAVLVLAGEMALGAGLPALKPSSAVAPQEVLPQMPSFFLCPIHLGIMKEPVTLSTGITYDRRSIERWLDAGHKTCPTTNQVLDSFDLIPNNTLHRAIQTWRAANPARVKKKKGVELAAVERLLDAVHQCTDQSSFQRLYAVAEECKRNRKTLHEAGAVSVLADALASTTSAKSLQYAVATIAILDLDDEDRHALSAPAPFRALCSLLISGTTKAKISAAAVLHFVCGDSAGLKFTVAKHPGAIESLVALLRDETLTTKELNLGLRVLLSLALPKKNRAILVDARAVSSVVELLPRNDDTSNAEYSCAILEVLANCAEGREAIASHPFAVPRLVSCLLGISHEATDHAVGALLAVIELASDRSVVKAALSSGAFTKLLMLLPSDSSQRAKTKARDTLKLLNEPWGTYPSNDSSITIDRHLS